MGQQQLLLIVLGIIIVGIAIIVGISMFKTHAVDSKRNNIINDLLHLASEAQKYYRTPISLGGGSQKFTGWEIPKKLRTNADGSFTVVVSESDIVLTGIGNEVVTGNDYVEVEITVTSDTYTTVVIH